MKPFLFLSTAAVADDNPTIGGGEHFASEFLRRAAESDWSAILAAPSESPIFRRQLPDSISCRRLALQSGFGKPVVALQALMGVRRLIQEFAPHLVYGNGIHSLKWIAGATVGKQIPTICHLHESDFSSYHYSRIRWLARGISRFIAISQCVKDAFVSSTGIPPGRVVVIHNGIDLPDVLPQKTISASGAFKATLGIPADHQIVLMAARTDPLKGHLVLVEAFARILPLFPKTTLLLAGIEQHSSQEIQLAAQINDCIRAHQVGDRVKISGYRPDVRKWMELADVVAVPSLAEGFGRTAIEGMGAGTPVVASSVGGLPEIIQTGKTGVLVPPGNSVALAGAIINLLQHPQRRALISEDAFGHVMRHFSMKMMWERINDLMTGMVRVRRSK